MANRTRRFGFTKLDSTADTVAVDGYKFGTEDRDVLDRLLALATEGHVHDGNAKAETASNGLGPNAFMSVTGGHLPSGTDVLYRYALVDDRGHETRASAVTRVAVPRQIAAPAQAVVGTDYTSGSLVAGPYAYALSAYTDSSEQETPSGPSTLINLTATGRVLISGSNPPQGAQGYNVYRRGPGDSDYGYLGTFTIDDDGLYDDGAIETDPNHRRPTRNTTNSTCAVALAPPEALPSGYAWRVYRSYDASNWVGSLLYVGYEPNVTDVGGPTQVGMPHDSDASLASPPPVMLTNADHVAGELPAGANEVYIDVIFDFTDPLAVASNQWVWINEYRYAAVTAARAMLDRDATAEGSPVTASLYRLPAGGGSWEEITTLTHRPTVPVGENWGSLVLATPLTLDSGDALSVDIADLGTIGPSDSHLRIIVQLVVGGGFIPDDDTITHEWSP